MFSRDEMQRAIEDALKSMEGIALELYRRGREPLLEELEDCRARSADLCTMLEQVTRDRDHVEESLVRLETQRDEARALVDQLGAARDKAEAELRDLQRSTSEALAQAVEWQRERDEARAEVEHAYREGGALYEAKIAEREAFRRGAEAMREACAQWFREHDESFELTVDACHDVIADMPIPEEP